MSDICCINIECSNYGIKVLDKICSRCGHNTNDNFHARIMRERFEGQKEDLDKINKMPVVTIDNVRYKRVPKSAGLCYGCNMEGNCVHIAKECHKSGTICRKIAEE